MKAVIFAGGVGTRMWPVSRTQTPKQFEPLIKNQSTIEVFYHQMSKYFPTQNIYISTNSQYLPLLKKRLPKFPITNIILEPARRDLGPAVGYVGFLLNRISPTEPVAILWSDDIFKNPNNLYHVFDIANEYLQSDPTKYLYIGEKPLFPDQNKGWIHFGKPVSYFDGITICEYLDWHYRPPLALTKKYFTSGKYAVNTGDFVTTPQHIVNLYQKLAPEMSKQLNLLTNTWMTPKFKTTLNKI